MADGSVCKCVYMRVRVPAVVAWGGESVGEMDLDVQCAVWHWRGRLCVCVLMLAHVHVLAPGLSAWSARAYVGATRVAPAGSRVPCMYHPCKRDSLDVVCGPLLWL